MDRIMRYLLAVIISIILTSMHFTKVFADVSNANLFLAGRGYKPVEDNWAEKPAVNRSPDRDIIPDNPRYKEWCMNTFNNGEHIYEAYREIAFNIDYCAEPPKTDYWQTPIETQQSKKGDCEDSVFLFFSHLSGLDIDGDMVWGWVVDKESSVAFAHVWYQLFDKRGKAYIVEGFSKEWNGIIPEEMTRGIEERVPTLMLQHNKINRAADETIPAFTEAFDEEQFPWSIFLNTTVMIKEIFQKLQDMFTRYNLQMHQLTARVQQSSFHN